MKSNPLVSVIITFYNTPESFIKEAIDSVLAQTYDNWQLILVDDGSDGPCTSIASDYAANYPDRVFYHEHDGHVNKGLSASRNSGVQHAEGEFIAFLDSDDVWLPHKLDDQIKIFISTPSAGMVYGKSQYWRSWTGNPEDLQKDRIQGHGIDGDMLIEPPKLLSFFLEGRALLPCPCSIVVRKEVIAKIGGFEIAEDQMDLSRFSQDGEDIKAVAAIINNMYEDQIFFSKVCLEHPVFVANKCWDRYRQHSDSICAGANDQEYRLARNVYLKWLTDYLAANGYKDTEVWKALQTERWFRRHWWIGRRLKRTQRFFWRLQGTYPQCTIKK